MEEAVSPALTLAMRAMYQSRVSLEADRIVAMLWPSLACRCTHHLSRRGKGQGTLRQQQAPTRSSAALGLALLCCEISLPALLYLPLDQAGKYLLRRGGGLKKLRQMTGG